MFAKDIIKEDIIEITQANELLRELKIDKENYCDDYKYAYIVYDKNAKRLIKAFWGATTDELEKWRGFAGALDKYIKKEDPKKLVDYMFFLDIRTRSKIGNFSMEDIYGRKFEENVIVDGILADSKGFLLWPYQLENLIGLFYFDTTKPSELGKGLSVFRDEYVQEAKEMKLKNNLSLYDVIVQRRVCDRTSLIFSPRWYYAYNLYNAVNPYIMRVAKHGIQ